MSEKQFTIQMAATFSGLSAHTIRAWEKRYQAVTPKRNKTGNRYYSEVEVDRLKLLASLVNLGSSIGQIAHLPNQELTEIYQKLNQTKERFGSVAPLIKKSVDEIYAELVTQVNDFNVKEVSELLLHARSVLDPRRLVFQIISPLLKILDQKKTDGRMKIAQVHAVTALIKFHAGIVIYSHVEKDTSSAKRFVLTSLEDSHTSVGLHLTALLCCHYRKKFFYLNSNLPAPSIAEAFHATDSQILILNVTDTTDEKLVRETIQGLPSGMEIWVVGQKESVVKVPLKTVTHFKDIQDLDKVLEASIDRS